MMTAANTTSPTQTLPFQRLPHEMHSFAEALTAATRALVDADAVHPPHEEMYAVLDAPSFTCAYALLCIGLARYADGLSLSLKEDPTQILLRLCGVRRVAGAPLSSADVLPRTEALAALLSDCLRKNGAEFAFRADGDALSLTVALPRFLSERYEVCALHPDKILEFFYDTMRLSAGQTPQTLCLPEFL